MADGIHELTAGYALDALGPDERLSFEAHLGTCPECREELASFWQVTGSLALAAAGPAPSRGLRDRILTEARAERPNVVPLRPRRWALPAAAAVAAVAAVAAIGLGIWASSLSRSLDSSRDALRDERAVSAVLADPGARTVALNGTSGRLVVSPARRAALVISSLDRAPSGKAYEIWVIEGGTPRRAGLFDGTGGRTVAALERAVPRKAVVAVTVEDDAGVDVPSAAPIITSDPV